MEGVASVTAKIDVNVRRVKKYDVFLNAHRKVNLQLYRAAGVFFAGAAVLAFFNQYIPAGITGLIALLLIGLVMRRGQFSKEGIISMYTEGLLVAAVIRKTNPLTILSLVNITAGEADTRYGCIEFAVENLPGHKLLEGERITCSAMFQEGEDKNYWLYYQAHPLCWATDNMEDIRRSMEDIEPEDWDALERLRVSLPDADMDMMYVLDEQFELIDSRKYDEDPEDELVIPDSIRSSYQKQYDSVHVIKKDMMHANLYEKLLELSIKHQVYEYLFPPSGDEDECYLTYIKNPVKFMKKTDSSGCKLAEGEIPLLAGNFLVTTKGIWMKGEFTPWEDAEIEIDPLITNVICTNINKKEFASFFMVLNYYPLDDGQRKNQKPLLRTLEQEHLTNFWMDVKNIWADMESH